MTLVSSGVVDGDVLDDLLNSGSAFYNSSSDRVGVASNFFKDVFNSGYLGRFELEIPDGATINAVRMAFVSDGRGTIQARSWQLGFVDDDGPNGWLDDGISSSTYPNRIDVPWPLRWSGTATIDNAGAWVGNAVPSTITESTITSLGLAWSFGEGLSALHSVTGLVANLQTWLDSSPDRANSASGTALPCAFCAVIDQATTGNVGLYALEAVEANRPILWVDYTPGITGGKIEAALSLETTSSARATSDRTVQAGSSNEPTVAGRTSVTVTTAAESELSSPAAARGDLV